MDGKAVQTQMRLPPEIHKYIQDESNRMGIAQNAFLVILLEQGRMMWEAKLNLSMQVQS